MHQIAPFKKHFLGKHAPEPPSKCLATPRVAINRFTACNSPNSPNSPIKFGPPFANHTFAHGLATTKKFI